MGKIDLGQGLSILANVGVIAGILLLAYELNQNQRMMQAQTRTQISDTLVNMLSQDMAIPGLFEVMVKAGAGESLSPTEELLLDRHESMFWRYRENVSYQYRTGLYEASEYFPQREQWRRELNTIEPVRRSWCNRRGTLSADFVSEIDGLLENPCS